MSSVVFAQLSVAPGTSDRHSYSLMLETTISTGTIISAFSRMTKLTKLQELYY